MWNLEVGELKRKGLANLFINWGLIMATNVGWLDFLDGREI